MRSIIVTTFTAGHERTLPLWLLNQLGRPRDVPVTNVVALLVMLVTTLPILGAWWLNLEGNIIVDILFVSVRFWAVRLIEIEIHALIILKIPLREKLMPGKLVKCA